MDCIVHTTIGGYPLVSSVNRYNRWRFRPEERIIRCRQRAQRNPLTHGKPIDKLDAQLVDVEYVYSITADTLRRRLGNAGYNRASLEKEFDAYYERVCHYSTANHMHFTSERAASQTEAFCSASLNDWLHALAQTVKTGVTPAQRVMNLCERPGNLLVDIITGPDKPEFEELELEHGLPGFPCSTFDNMAVALLEVTDGNAECVLDVTSFVLHRGDITFDDLLGRRDEL